MTIKSAPHSLAADTISLPGSPSRISRSTRKAELNVAAARSSNSVADGRAKLGLNPLPMSMTCSTAALRGLRPRLPELDAYVTWRDAIWYCISDGAGGYTRVNTVVYLPPTPAELRESGTLDVYVAGAPWCDQVRPR